MSQRRSCPYREDYNDGRSNRGFTDLRGKPDLARQIPEAARSPAMQELLAALAKSGSRYHTNGCDLGATQIASGFFEAGGYIQIVFSDLHGLALIPRYETLARGLQDHLERAVEDRDWVVHFTISAIGVEALGGPKRPHLSLSSLH